MSQNGAQLLARPSLVGGFVKYDGWSSLEDYSLREDSVANFNVKMFSVFH